MLNEWQHPKSHEKRLYVTRKYVKPVAEKHGLNPKDIKAWFQEPKGAELPDLHVMVQTPSPTPWPVIKQIKADILDQCGLDAPVWNHLVSMTGGPGKTADSEDEGAGELEPVDEPESQRQARRGSRIGQASKLDIASIKVKAPVTIEVDHRETELMTSLLSEHPQVTVKRVQLDLADYRVVNRDGNELLIERKRCTHNGQKTDFEASIQSDARLFDQSERLKFVAANSDHQIIPIVLLEGDVYTNAGSMLIQQIDGALSFLATVQKISVWATYSARHSAYTLLKLASHFQDGLYDQVSLHRGQKPGVLFEQKRYLLEALPGVSTVIAEALLAEFGTVAKVMAATEQQLSKVKGVGPKTSRNIYRVLH